MNFEVISPKNLESYLQQHTVVLIDVRSREEYRSGHWAGARNYPYEEVERWEKMMPGNAVLVFYCSHGGNSMQIARRLGMQGFRTASVIGGYPAMLKHKENNH
jgi:thiosulfate sulfurtransferase